MPPRRALAPALAVLATLALAACTPTSITSTPTPTELTQDEAYAQAEDAYRAYIDALNQIVISDPSTFEDAYALTTGSLNAQDRKQYSEWHAESYTKTGDAVVLLVQLATISDDLTLVSLATCLDVSQVDILDSKGNSVVDANRVDVQQVTADVRKGSTGRWQVEDFAPREGDPSCS